MYMFHKKYLEYVKAAKALEEIDSSIKLAKIDVTEEEELATKYDVNIYPYLKFFKSGNPIDYAGPRDAVVSVFHLSKLKKTIKMYIWVWAWLKFHFKLSAQYKILEANHS